MHDFQEQCQVHGQRSKNVACRFASSTQQEIEKLLEDKDSENTKRSTKVAKELFYENLKRKTPRSHTTKKRISASVEIFLCGSAIFSDGEIFSNVEARFFRMAKNNGLG